MMAAGQRSILLAAGFETERQRNHAQQRGQRGHENGAKANPAGLHCGLKKRQALLVQNAGELDDQNAVRDHDAGHHNHAHQRHDVQRAAGEEQNQNHSRQARRNGQENDERIDEGGKLGHQNQVHEQDRDDEAEAEIVEGLVHVDHGAAHVDHRVTVVAGLCQQAVDPRSHVLQSLGFGGDIDVDHAPNLVVIDLGWRVDLRRYRPPRPMARSLRHDRRAWVPMMRDRLPGSPASEHSRLAARHAAGCFSCLRGTCCRSTGLRIAR